MDTPKQSIQVGEVLEGRYRIISEGYHLDIGALYQAYDTWHDRPVRVLLLHRGFGSSSALLNRVAQANQTVTDLQQLGLVPFEQIGTIEGRVYLIRRHVEGHPLAEMLNRAGALKVNVAVEMAIHLCDALAPLHRAGIAHGGLSPHSITVQIDDQNPEEIKRSVILTDVGLVPELRRVPAPPGEPWGRVPYLCPEQAAGEDVQPASDVYVVGALLYEMLTGRPPFSGDDERVVAVQHRSQEPPSLRILMPQIPPQLDRIVRQALAKEPAARYRTASQLGHILRSQLGSQVSAPIPEAVAPRRAPAGGKLVVPPPPVPMPTPATTVRAMPQTYATASDAAHQAEEPDGVDWILVGLIVAALIAVLGLIPLWRTVYRRYAIPPAIPAPGSRHLTSDELAYLWPQTTNLESLTAENVGLGNLNFVWYNSPMPARKTNWPVWESSLRVSKTICIRLERQPPLEA